MAASGAVLLLLSTLLIQSFAAPPPADGASDEAAKQAAPAGVGKEDAAIAHKNAADAATAAAKTGLTNATSAPAKSVTLAGNSSNASPTLRTFPASFSKRFRGASMAVIIVVVVLSFLYIAFSNWRSGKRKKHYKTYRGARERMEMEPLGKHADDQEDEVVFDMSKPETL